MEAIEAVAASVLIVDLDSLDVPPEWDGRGLSSGAPGGRGLCPDCGTRRS